MPDKLDLTAVYPASREQMATGNGPPVDAEDAARLEGIQKRAAERTAALAELYPSHATKPVDPAVTKAYRDLYPASYARGNMKGDGGPEDGGEAA